MAFLVIAAAFAIATAMVARRREREARESAAELKASLASLLATPSALLLGTTLAKKAFATIPLALIGGIVLGYAVSRSRLRADSKSSD
jgi:sensor c-di-GMP phosphodiesterase-like protein